MNQRIEKLRRQSLEAVNRISAERALLVTEFYKHHVNKVDPVAVQRARAFEFILARKEICVSEDELIVGERGPAPKATPTYPEISLHSLDDLDVLHNREKVSFKVDAETRKAYQEVIIPFWKGKSNRDRIMQRMSEEWINAYQAGVFTEFMEQRAPGHTVAGAMIFRKGMNDLIEEIDAVLHTVESSGDPKGIEKRVELTAMKTAAAAIVMYAHRYSEKLEQLAQQTDGVDRKKELLHQAAICRRVPAHAPSTFHEALQHYWFLHQGVITELNPWDSFNPGRLDQHLWPFYVQETEAGTLTIDQAKELLQAFWIKFNNHPAPPKVGVTAQESNTYTDFTLINLGGVKADGTDAVNELTFLLLDVIEEMRLLQPGTMVQLSRVNPDAFIDRAVEITRTGFGQPSIFNTDAIVQELTAQGKSLEDARNGGVSGCVEAGAFGTESYILTGYFNLPKVLEITIHNGVDPLTGKQIGLKTGSLSELKTYDHLLTAFRQQVQYFADVKTEGSNAIETLFMEHLPTPFLSLIIEDCILTGTDYIKGGARYNTNYVQGVGLGSVTDILTSWRFNIFEKKLMAPDEFLEVLNNNFIGNEKLLHHLLYKTPKYGNDDDRADRHAIEVFEIFYEAVTGKKSPRGATYRINLLPTTCHVYFGSVMQASADGRRAGMPLSEGISPVQGADSKGPTSVMKSASKIDHLRTGGTLLNQKFTPSFFYNEESVKKVSALVCGYFRLNGHHVQFNVVDADTLRDAQKHPEKHRDLIVRVAGYSDYFNDLGRDLQDEIIRRTAHEGM